MNTQRSIHSIALAAALVLAAPGTATFAQTYPSRPVKLVVGGPPGGAPDIAARAIADQLSVGLGQKVVVENRAGAGGTIAAQAVAKSEADGYTLLFGSMSNLACAPSLFRNLAYDPMTSFTPVSQLTSATFVVLATAAVPADSLKDLIALAKSKPGALRFASNGNGGALHIGAEKFKTAAGVDLLHVPYKGGALAIPDLLANRIQLIFDQPASYLAHIRSGKLKALAVAGPKRISGLPDVPTAKEAGLPAYENVSRFSLVAPSGTPEEIVRRLNEEVRKALDTKGVRDALAPKYIEPIGSSPEALAKMMRSDLDTCARVIKTAGIKAK